MSLDDKLSRKVIFNRAFSELVALKNENSDNYSKVIYIPVSGIGDGILFTAVAKALYLKNRKKILISHHHNELFINNPYIKTIDGIYDPVLTIDEAKQIESLGFDLVYPSYFNYKLIDDRYYLEYPSTHIIAQTASRTGFNGNLDLKPEIYLTEDEKKFGRFSKERKQIVIMSTAIDKHKQYDKWQQVVNRLKDDFYIIQIGSSKDIKLDHIDDRRGKFTLRECASVLYNSDLFVGQIGGLMHMARAVDCPAVIAYSSAEPDYFVRYICNANVMPSNRCDICVKKNSPFSNECKKKYVCIKSVDVNGILDAIYEKIKIEKKELPYETVEITNSCNCNLEDYKKRYSNKLYLKKTPIINRIFYKIKNILRYA